MRYVRYGHSELEVSRLGLDCKYLGVAHHERGWDPFSYDGRVFAVRTVHAALDVGINVFHSPPCAGGGRAESLLGQALRGRRRGALLATTISDGPKHWRIERALRASMRRLRTDTIDIVYVQDTVLARDRRREYALAEIDKLRAQGTVDHVGLLVTDPTKSLPLIVDGNFEMVQLQCDLSLPGLASTVLDSCHRRGLGISISKSIESDNLRRLIDVLDPKWNGTNTVRERCLKRLLRDRRVHMINVGMRWEFEVVQNAMLLERSADPSPEPALAAAGLTHLGAA